MNNFIILFIKVAIYRIIFNRRNNSVIRLIEMSYTFCTYILTYIYFLEIFQNFKLFHLTINLLHQFLFVTHITYTLERIVIYLKFFNSRGSSLRDIISFLKLSSYQPTTFDISVLLTRDKYIMRSRDAVGRNPSNATHYCSHRRRAE